VDKTERPSFDTAELIEAESLVVLNTLTKQDFQDAFKNDRKTEAQRRVALRFLLTHQSPFISDISLQQKGATKFMLDK
jgi:hypothetical protein